MSKLAHEFEGVLQRRPFKLRATPAMAQFLPLSKESDFARFAELTTHGSPVFINFAEHYEVLTNVVEQAMSAWPELFVLIRVSMPGGMRIPKTLLHDNVLLLEDVRFEEEKLAQYDENLLVIEDYFVHFDMEKGNNQFAMRLYSNSPAEAEFAKLRDMLAEFGVN